MEKCQEKVLHGQFCSMLRPGMGRRVRRKLCSMACSPKEQKRIESWFLSAARNSGVPIPIGELPGEEPDFRFQTTSGALGIELSEVLRPASRSHGIIPVAEEAFHREVIDTAQRSYYSTPNAKPTRVGVYFTKSNGERSNRRKLADSLSKFVMTNIHRATPAICFDREESPGGFDSVLIVEEAHPTDWWSGEGGGVTLGEIKPQVEARITDKNKLVDKYRRNLPAGAHLWLLLYTRVTVAGSMPIPLGAEKWQIPSQFDRVFWFAALENQFVEINQLGSKGLTR